MFPGLFQWSAIHSISCCCNKKMKEKKLIDLLTDMRCCEICVLLLLSFQQMSIKHKKSLFPNITRDDNYHKSIFQISIMCPYCQIPSRRKSAAIRIDGWGTVLRITSQNFRTTLLNLLFLLPNNNCFLRYSFPRS